LSSEGAAAETAEPTEANKWPSWWVLGLQLAALWSLGLVRPLFDVLGTDEAFFVARGNTPGDILIFAIGLTFVPPLVLTIVELIVGAVSARAARIVHLVFVALLAALLALQFVKGAITAAPLAFVISLAIGALVGWGFWKTPAVRSFLTIITPASFIFLALFIFASPVTDVIMPSSEGSGASGAAGQSGNSTPVVLVIFDEFPLAALLNKDTSINAARFPNFAKLAAGSTWYKNDTTVSDSTFSAVPAILTGKAPPDNLRELSYSQINDLYRKNIYTMLAASHRITNVEAITHVCPPALCVPRAVGDAQTRLSALFSDLSVVTGRTVLPQSLADQLPSVDATYGDFSPATSAQVDRKDRKNANPHARFDGTPAIAEVPGAAANNNGLRQVAQLQNSISGAGKPPLYVMHLLMPHVPWRFGPTGDQYFPNGTDAPGLDHQIWTTNQYQTDVALQRFIIQTEFTDKVIASVIGRMKRAGIWQRSLFIVTADHGVSFRAGGSRRPVTQQNLPELANTPLFVKYPGQQKGVVNLSPTRSIDIAPTVAKVTKTGQRYKFDGVPLDERQPNSIVSVRNGIAGHRVSAPSGSVIARRNALVRQWTTLFPGGLASVYRLGPNQQLIGRSVASLSAGSASGSTTIKFPNLYSHMNPASGVSQIYLIGDTNGVAANQPLAAAVDGKIVAVGQSFNSPSGVQFSIILPPASLRGSHALVQLYSVSGGSSIGLLGSAGH